MQEQNNPDVTHCSAGIQLNDMSTMFSFVICQSSHALYQSNYTFMIANKFISVLILYFEMNASRAMSPF